MSLEPAPPRLRRAYFECRYGQLHVHNAIPAGGGFDELTTLICLHASSSTGRSFLELSRILGTSAFGVQPRHCRAAANPTRRRGADIAGYAEAIGDFLDSMRFRQVDLLGVHSGAAVAAELAIARPKLVRKSSWSARRRSTRPSARVIATCRRRKACRRARWARAAVIDWKAERGCR